MLSETRSAIYNMCKTVNIPVYDYWVVDATFPYIITSSMDTVDTYLKVNDQTDYIFEIHIFDKNVGKKTVIDIIDQLRVAYISLDGIGKTFNQIVLDDKEPNVVHGIVTLRFTKYE